MPDFSTYAWNELAPATSPSARWGHAMVWDGSRIIMFGGATDAAGLAQLSETWEFDGTTWSNLAPSTTPGARLYPAMAFDGTNVLMHGGLGTADYYNDTWSFNGTDWTNVSGTADPAKRWKHTMAWDGTRMIMYGGAVGTGVKNDTWKFETGAWTQLTPTNYIVNIRHPGSSPAGADGRAGMRSVWDGSRVLLFSGFSDTGGGGEFQTGPYFETGGGTWQYATSNWTQVGPTTNPAARWGQGYCVTDDDQKVLMYGGNVSYVGGFNNAYNSETWQYDGTDWTQLGVTGPVAREAPMVWDDVGARGLMFGGRKDVSGVNVSLDETWEFATAAGPAPTIKAINNTFGLG